MTEEQTKALEDLAIWFEIQLATACTHDFRNECRCPSSMDIEEKIHETFIHF